MIGEIDVGIFCDIYFCLEIVLKEYFDGNILSNKLLVFYYFGQYIILRRINLNEFDLLIFRYIFFWKFLIFDIMYNLKYIVE